MIATRMQRLGRDERGSIMVGGMMLVLVMTLVGSGVFYASVVDNRRALNDTRQTQTFYIAEAGLNAALRELADGNGTNDFATFSGSGTIFTNKPFGSGSFTATAAVTSSNPKTITVTSTACVPAITSGTCLSDHAVTLQGGIIYQLNLAGPFFALGTFSIGGSNPVVDSFDSNQGSYASTKCQKTTPPFDCGADVYANGGTASATTVTVNIDTSGTKVYGNISDSRGRVHLDTSVWVYGDVKYDPSIGSCQIGTADCPSPQALPQVQGQVIQGATFPVVPPSVQPCGPPYSPKTFVNSKITPVSGYDYTDTGSHAGELTVNGPVAIAPATFCFKTFKVKNSGIVSIPATQQDRVVISVTGGVDLPSGVTNNTGKADRFQILSSATTVSNNVSIVGGSTAYLYVYAPKTQIKVSGGGDLYGALLGNDLQISGNASLHFDKALGNSGNLAGGVPTYSWKSGTWKACQTPSC